MALSTLTDPLCNSCTAENCRKLAVEVSENTWVRKNSTKLKEGKRLALLEKTYANAVKLINEGFARKVSELTF